MMYLFLCALFSLQQLTLVTISIQNLFIIRSTSSIGIISSNSSSNSKSKSSSELNFIIITVLNFSLQLDARVSATEVMVPLNSTSEANEEEKLQSEIIISFVAVYGLNVLKQECSKWFPFKCVIFYD